MPSLKLRLVALAAVAIVPLGALTACDSSTAESASSGALKDGFGGRAQNRNVEFVTYYDPSQDAFWNQIKQGADDAAQVAHLTVKAETAAGDTGKMTDLINAAVASKPAALVIPFNDPAWENAACEADKAGILVFAYNVPPTGPAKSCVQAFVGQDFGEVGTFVGKKLVESSSCPPATRCSARPRSRRSSTRSSAAAGSSRSSRPRASSARICVLLVRMRRRWTRCRPG